MKPTVIMLQLNHALAECYFQGLGKQTITPGTLEQRVDEMTYGLKRQ
jgi:hypothetical protein